MYLCALQRLARRQMFSQLRPWLVARFYNTQSSDADSPIIRKVYSQKSTALIGSWGKLRLDAQHRESLPPKTSKPLRILFCGSDDFSSTSLRGLYDEHRRNPDLIASIDVLCRPGKPAGRDLKTIREVPIKDVAKELGLPVHERDTFTGWDLPKPQDEPINLIVAVSFGLFVPPRILKSAEYGGLNVHPSILPDLRGPAPLQHTIMLGRKMCGVTLQTLDEASFDNGIILAQTPRYGLELPNGNKCTYQDLLRFITPLAAAMLVKGIRDRVFVPPLLSVGSMNGKRPTHARKITAADKHLNWRDHFVTTIERQYRALGRLWCYLQLGSETKRVIFEDLEVVPIPEVLAKFLNRHRGEKNGPIELEENEEGIIRFVLVSHNEKLRPRFYVVDGDAVILAGRTQGALRVKEITVEGRRMKIPAAQWLPSLADWKDWEIRRLKVAIKRSRGEETRSLKEEFARDTPLTQIMK